jgi:hypothetical protein
MEAAPDDMLLTDFRASCENHDSYPVFLLERARYEASFLERCRQRFASRQDTAPFLIQDEDDKFQVSCIDVARDGKVSASQLGSDQQLSDKIGDSFPVDPQDLTRSVYKADPVCRFLYACNTLHHNASTCPARLLMSLSP